MKQAITLTNAPTVKSAVKSKKMGFWTVLLFGINSILGSGIFLLPNEGMRLFGPASIFVLAFDAVLVLTIGLCFAEDSSLFDETGGAYVYAKAAFGNFVGYEVGFVTWTIRIIAEGTLYVGFATAVAGVFPELNNPLDKDIIVTIMALTLMTVNLFGIKVAAILNNAVTVSKLLPLVFFIAIGIWFIKGGNFTPMIPASVASKGSFAKAAMTMFFVFTGIESSVVAAGEMKNPKKDLPRVLIIVILAVAAFYILVQTVCIGVLGKSLAVSTTPIQDAFGTMVGSFGKYLVAAGTLMSIGGVGFSTSFITPRFGVAMAEYGMMPQFLTHKNRFGVPHNAIIISALLGLLVAVSGSFNTLVQISAVSRFAQYIPSCLAVLVFRKTMKNRKSGFKIPFGWFIPVLAITVSLWLLAQTSISNLIWGFGALLVAVPFYFLSRKNFID
ncbi:APC family permease [Companilactobacillus heilongjiangensis]|uniref:Amino acid permease n=1 Tax=Companilactobacillus heilongjiangensis TaxID=1074467 RepID=A0A0K2LBW0_9LACO|nr:APC family permease [Companilactobacillus heilongjiangensis]ALB28792.1 amino acid permease [Companilactobacillus heilongjiangensis]